MFLQRTNISHFHSSYLLKLSLFSLTQLKLTFSPENQIVIVYLFPFLAPPLPPTHTLSLVSPSRFYIDQKPLTVRSFNFNGLIGASQLLNCIQLLLVGGLGRGWIECDVAPFIRTPMLVLTI